MPGKRKQAIFSSSSCFLSVYRSSCFTDENAKDESERRSFYSHSSWVTWSSGETHKGEGGTPHTPKKERVWALADLLIAAHSCSQSAHSCSLVLLVAHSCSQSSHSCSQSAHGCSLVRIAAHSCSQSAHGCSIVRVAAHSCSQSAHSF